jgi:hypothetical protein
MARRLMIHVSGGWYHVMSRGDAGEVTKMRVCLLAYHPWPEDMEADPAICLACPG